MQTREVVGIGRTAEVLAWEEGKVIKLYYPSFPRENAEHEAGIAEAIQNASLPGPKYYGMVEVDGRPGLIYERISGPVLISWLEKHPWKIDYVARLMAKLHYRIHQQPAPGAPNQRKRLEYKINNASLLPSEKMQKALAILTKLPDGDRLCHNDFHPGNIMLTDHGPIVIDWVDVTVGNPLADVGRTALLMRSSHIPEDFPARKLLLLFRNRLHDIYLRSYARLAHIRLEDIRAWDYPITAARLDENIIEENELLLQSLD